MEKKYIFSTEIPHLNRTISILIKILHLPTALRACPAPRCIGVFGVFLKSGVNPVENTFAGG